MSEKINEVKAAKRSVYVEVSDYLEDCVEWDFPIDPNDISNFFDRAFEEMTPVLLWKEIGLDPYRKYTVDELRRIQNAIEALNI